MACAEHFGIIFNLIEKIYTHFVPIFFMYSMFKVSTLSFLLLTHKLFQQRSKAQSPSLPNLVDGVVRFLQ